MAQRPHRILCVDSSSNRLHAIACALEKAGFHVWTAGSVKEAVCLALGLRFDAVVADQGVSSKSAGVWDYLREMQPRLPVFIHSRDQAHGSPPGPENAANGSTPEMILAILTILLHPRGSAPISGTTAA